MPLSSNNMASSRYRHHNTTDNGVVVLSLAQRRANRRLALVLGAVAVAWFVGFIVLTIGSI